MELKKLIEKRNALLDEMQAIADKAVAETRAFTEQESADYDAKKSEAEELEKTISRCQEQRSKTELAPSNNETKEESEKRAFEQYLRTGNIETRSETTMNVSDNGAVIPASIANKIIEKVVEICPIYNLADRYNVGGTLSIPYYDESTQAIEVAYATEFTDLGSTSGKFISIELKGYLAGALSKISKSLINNSAFDIVGYVVNKVAQAFAKWIEKELLIGSSEKITGLSNATQIVTAAAATAITADELIDLQESVPDAYQAGAIWIMSKSTRTAIRKLKDKDGNYILNKDATAQWGYTLLGKPVYVSDSMPAMKSNSKAIYYGDMSGLAVKVSENVSIEILREKFATQHAIGVVGWMEIDSKIENQQKIAVLKMGA